MDLSAFAEMMWIALQPDPPLLQKASATLLVQVIISTSAAVAAGYPGISGKEPLYTCGTIPPGRLLADINT